MSARVASLPMYDFDRPAVETWWRALARELASLRAKELPAALAWPQDLDAHWSDDRLLLSQTCGYPLVTRLAGRVRVVGAFRYKAPGCSGIEYRSELVARVDDAPAIEDFRGRVAVVNSFDSHSGSNALRGLVAPLAIDGKFFGAWKVSGSHRASLSALRSGTADLAAIDCVSLAGFRGREPQSLAGLKVLGSTGSAPGLPLVTSLATPEHELELLREALSACCADRALSRVRDALFIDGFEVVPVSAWNAIADIRRSALAV